MRFLIPSFLVLGLVFFCAACLPKDGQQQPDSSSNDDTTTPPTDTDNTTDTGPVDTSSPDTDTPETVTGNCDRNGFNGRFVERIDSFQDPAGNPSSIIYAVNESNSEPTSTFQIELYTGGPTGPGTYELTGENYRDCLLCVRIRGGCTISQGCEKTFLAQSGTVQIDVLDDRKFEGRVSNLEFIEVTIDNDNQFTSTPVPNGETWCVPEYDFDAAFPASAPDVQCDQFQPAFVPDTIKADISGNEEFVDRIIFLNAQQGTSPRDVLRFQLFEPLGAELSVGTHAYDYVDYENCSTCIRVGLDCEDDANGDPVCPGGEYLAVSGTIEITSVGDEGSQFTGELKDFEFYEHHFNEEAFTSTPFENGRSFCVDSMPFDVLLEARPQNNP